MKIQLKLSKAHSEAPITEDMLRELTEVKAYLDKADFKIEPGRLGVLPLGGYYVSPNTSANIAFLLVNAMDVPIVSVSGTLAFDLGDESVRLAALDFDFDRDFFGILAPGEGMLLHLNVPVAGEIADGRISASAIGVKLSNLRVGYLG